MPTFITAPYSNIITVINVLAVTAAVGLSAFIAYQILATAPNIAVEPIRAEKAEAAHVAIQTEFNGIIAWVTSKEIKITDTSGVTRIISITPDTQVLVKGYPVGSASYKNLRILSHARIVALQEAGDLRAKTIVVQ